MAVAVGDVITAAHINDIEDAASGALPHEEWTATSASTASNTPASVGTLTRDAGVSNATLATISTNVLTVSASGLYDVTITGSIPSSPTGNFNIRFTDGTDYYFVRGDTGSALIGGSVASALRLPASTPLTFTFIHVSGSSRVLTCRVRLTKVGTY